MTVSTSLDLDAVIPPACTPYEILRCLRYVDASDDDIAEARTIFDDMKAHGLRDGDSLPLDGRTYRQINAMLQDGLIYIHEIDGARFIACIDDSDSPVVNPCTVYIDRGNVRVRPSDADDEKPVYVGIVDGDDVYFPRMIGRDKIWPITSIESITIDRSGPALIIIKDDAGNRISCSANYSDIPLTKPISADDIML